MVVALKYQTRSRAETPQNTARRLFDANKRDKAKTVRQLVNLADNQKTLREYLIKLGASTLVGGVVVGDRKVALGRSDNASRLSAVSPANVIAIARARGNVMARNRVRALMDFPLSCAGNKLLRHATKEEVSESAQVYRGQADNANFHARWLSAVASQLPKGKTVEDVFTERALQKIQDQSRE